MTQHVIAYRSKELLFGMHAFDFNCFLDDLNCVFTQIRCLSVLPCKLLVHKKCSGLQGPTLNPDYRCAWEMSVLLMAGNRVKSRSDLISWRW